MVPDERSAMITQQRPPGQPVEWTGAPELIRDAAQLLERLDLAPEHAGLSAAAARDFPLRVPRAYVDRMKRGDPADPLLRQVLSTGDETAEVPGYGGDPLGESEFSPVPGILHKYHGRVLLVVTGACAVHCRYCFRRHFPYDEQQATGSRLEAALAWLARRPDVEEIILSGGDPLSLSDRRLGELLTRLGTIPHLRRLRIHTRLPVVEPARLTSRLQNWLTDNPWQTLLVLHANHGREIGPALTEGLDPLRRSGLTLLNQAVLLRGVNDSADALAGLSEGLFAAGVLPYYLHMLDPVAGAAHFEVPEDEARALHEQLRARMPGYLVPRLVREDPGEMAKTLLA
jgi:EF-P beta-lysylation protein EpmB